MKNLQLNKLTESAIEIVHNAGMKIMHFYQTSFDIRLKGEFDLVTAADLASENYIIEELSKLTPDIQILAEESSETDEELTSFDKNDCYWILDPLDGTTNFAHGFPHFAISLALFNGNVPVAGIIFDPVKQETFHSIRGQGAYLNDQKLSVSENETLKTSLIATGFPYKVRELEQNNLREFCTFRLNCQGVRRVGAAALDLAYVAAGRLDGFWERWLKPWDTAAGILMVQEAGGTISRFNGCQYSIFHPDIVCSNTHIHSQMLQILQAPLSPLPDYRLSQF